MRSILGRERVERTQKIPFKAYSDAGKKKRQNIAFKESLPDETEKIAKLNSYSRIRLPKQFKT